MFLKERSGVGVGVPTFCEAATFALAGVTGRAIVRAVAPVAVVRRGTAVVLGGSLGGECAVVLGMLEGVAALPVAGYVVAVPSVRVGVVYAHGGPGRRLLHRLGVATGAPKRFRAPRRAKRATGVPVDVRVIHERDGGTETLASTVDIADSFLARARGLMFRASVPDDYALVFEFGGRTRRDVHMVFVPFAIDVLWLADDEVQALKTLSAWTGLGAAEADRLIELPAGAAADVSVGDTVRVE